jgi:hypothetical protein
MWEMTGEFLLLLKSKLYWFGEPMMVEGNKLTNNVLLNDVHGSFAGRSSEAEQ